MSLQLIHPVHRATHRIGLYLAALGEPGLTQGEAHILALLAKSNEAGVADLHRGLAHKRSTLTSILDRLEHRRLIKREIAALDRRSFTVRLTAKGQKLANRVHQHLKTLERLVLSRVSQGELKSFCKVVAALEEATRRRKDSPPAKKSSSPRMLMTSCTTSPKTCYARSDRMGAGKKILH